MNERETIKYLLFKRGVKHNPGLSNKELEQKLDDCKSQVVKRLII